MTDPRVHDVVIVGAGPAGAAVAARLHQHGVRDVVVLDRYDFPRDKPCGGGLTGHIDEALAAVDLRLTVPSVASPAATVRFGSFERTVTMGRPVRVIRRVEFDASLVEQVRAKGVELRTGVVVDELAVAGDHVALKLGGGGQLAAKIVVGADGAASVVRKHLTGNAKALPHRLFMAELPVAATAAPRDDAMIYDFTAMADGLRGYVWLFPVAGDRVNVGLMHYPSSRRGGPELLALLRKHLAPYGVALPAKGSRGWPVWGYHPSAPVSAPRLVTVGDAAGIDGLTGEGIAVAMEQAQVAGDAIARALTSGDVGFAGYRRALRKAVVGRELALDRHLARLLYQHGPGWQRWLSLVLFDPDVLEMYAARVAGTEVLADQKARLWGALVRHGFAARRRRRELTAAAAR
ncbi:MAG: NAD(P)/FAD-dependent oxidoreductase [Myxococcales bacterium]|nr:NAD(P)/FAD-dependent oxidoreductase [Myxococcales bacterium]MBK7194271.1 NAD(P)/FAD-dependent oxidoreductase [Myxococcales bacterium]MBP6847418.1 NAD(P)/FAD-dependent oxidoreductase [Kofleriaceae bacterium]